MSELKHKDAEKVSVGKEAATDQKEEKQAKPRSLVDFAKKHWIPIVSILYVLFPIDIIPDFLPVAGAADDITVLLFGLYKAYVEYKKGSD